MSADQNADEFRRVVTPTRVIPPGAPLPERGPQPGETPPWRAAPPPPAAPVQSKTAPAAPPAAPPGLPPWWGHGWPWGTPPPQQPQGPIELHVTVDMLPPVEEEPTWRERLGVWAWGLVRPLWTWRGALALLFAVAPINAAGDSAASAWHETVVEAREMGIVIGYIVGLTPLAFAGWALGRVGVTVPRVWLLLVTGIGATGAMSWYDIVQLLTGVTR